MSNDDISWGMVVIIFSILAFCFGGYFGLNEGIERGSRWHYQGKYTCETLLDKTVRCIPTSQVKEN